MKIQQDIIFKYLDIIIIEAEIAEASSSKNILHEKYINPITDEERYEYFEICEKTVSLGSKLGFMIRISKEEDWFELTKKGIQAKELGGYFKYIESIKNKELKSELKTNSIRLKFWKLISENQLISSLILVVILYAIKRIFNIEL